MKPILFGDYLDVKFDIQPKQSYKETLLYLIEIMRVNPNMTDIENISSYFMRRDMRDIGERILVHMPGDCMNSFFEACEIAREELDSSLLSKWLVWVQIFVLKMQNEEDLASVLCKTLTLVD
jgi:hypothetical protein